MCFGRIFFLVIRARKRPKFPKAEVLTDNLFIPEMRVVGRVPASPKQNGAKREKPVTETAPCALSP